MSSFNLNVEVEKISETELLVKLRGELDQLSLNDLKEKLQEVSADNVRQLIFDLAELEFMASAGLAIFAFYHELFKKNASGQEMKIVKCSDAAMRVFKLTRMDQVLNIS